MDREYLRSRIKEILEAVGELKRLTSKPYPDMKIDEKYSMRYQVVVLTEALGSIGLHINREDLEREPGSYAEALKTLETEGLIESSNELIKMVRLRNLLVHKYWTIDDAQIYESIRKNFTAIEKFTEKIADAYGIR